uniref:Uncharacterized protein n=1 Tax=Oryza barthii TaxID=65489 RepID=A0A0D3G7P5_9ORYZ
MAQKLNSNFCLKWVAFNRCSTKCSKGYKKLLMSHPERNPWPPPCSGGVVCAWAAGNYLGIIFYFKPSWPPPTQIGTIILWLLVNIWLTEVELKSWPDPQPSQYSGGVMWTEQVPWPAPVFAHLMGYDFCRDLNHEKSDRAHKDTLVAIFNLEQFHYVGGEEKVTEGMLYGLSTVSCNYLIIPAATMTTTFLSVPSSTQNIYEACWLEAQKGLNDIAKGRTYKICKSMRMTLNHVESWLQNSTNILYNGQLFNCPAGIHFGVRRISGIIARGAGENQNRKVKTCGYDSIFDFCENNPSDGSAAARFSIDTGTDSEMIYASIANRDYWSVKLLEVIKEGCPIRHLLLGDIKKEQLLQCETFSTRQTNTEQVIKLQVSNSKEIQELQVPWDPGGFLHRLGDKPNFKKRGLSETRVGCTWTAGYTTGWSAHRQEAQASPS